MTRLWSEGAAVEAEQDPRGNLCTIIWQGRTHRVQRILQHWQVDVDWGAEAGAAHRDYQAVITHDGLLCVLYLDFADERWYLARIYD
jgi:hypothetical protein